MGLLCVAMETATWLLFLFVLQVQTLYYSADHKLVDGGLVIEGHSEVFGGDEDHLQFVQVLNSLCLASRYSRPKYIMLRNTYLLSCNQYLAMHKTNEQPVPGNSQCLVLISMRSLSAFPGYAVEHIKCF